MPDEVVIKLDKDLANEISSILCEEAALASTSRALFSATLPRAVWRRKESLLKRFFRVKELSEASIVEFVQPQLSENFTMAWFEMVFNRARRIHARNRKFWAKVAERYKDAYDTKYAWGLQCQGKVVFISRGELLSKLAEKAIEEVK